MRNTDWTMRACRTVVAACAEAKGHLGCEVWEEHGGGLMPYELEAVQRLMRLREWVAARASRRGSAQAEALATWRRTGQWPAGWCGGTEVSYR